MNRDKVSEMARVMCGREKDCLVCPIQSPCLMRNCAELLNAEGYRKASDVAREIFEDIKSIWRKGKGFIKYTDLVDLERIYENKYESEREG